MHAPAAITFTTGQTSKTFTVTAGATGGAKAITYAVSGTNAASFRTILERLGVPVHVVDETDTSYRARALYFADHPPRGWRRLVPLGLQLPPRPIDDYAALLIARRYAETGF